MRRTSSGFTIVEVLIVLAITSVIFLGIVTAFRGQQGETQFSQAMEDIQSKIQSYINQVSSSSYPDSQNFSCTVTSLRPIVTQTASSPGTNDKCVFLGRAIQVIPDTDSLYIYTVVGDRDQWSGGTDTHMLATSYAQANPEPAINSSSPPTWYMVDAYNLQNGATVVSSKVQGSGTAYNLIGIYSSLQTPATNTTGSTSLLAKAYNLNGDDTTKSTTIKSCIEEAAPPCGGIQSPLTQWLLCVQSGGSNQKALLTMNSQDSGVTTKLSYTNCS